MSARLLLCLFLDSLFLFFTLRYQDQVWHIRINNSSRGFGLVEADDSDVYVTLTQLVHYYNKQSLEVHNQFLHTTLMLPLRVIKDRDESDA